MLTDEIKWVMNADTGGGIGGGATTIEDTRLRLLSTSVRGSGDRERGKSGQECEERREDDGRTEQILPGRVGGEVDEEGQ